MTVLSRVQLISAGMEKLQSMPTGGGGGGAAAGGEAPAGGSGGSKKGELFLLHSGLIHGSLPGGKRGTPPSRTP